MEEKLLWAWFAECFPYGSIKHLQILRNELLEDFYENRRDCIMRYDFITKSDYRKIMERDKEDYISMIEQCHEKRIKTITWQDEDYPHRLRQIDNPPMMMYYQGDLDSLSEKICIAVVGTRNCTLYSERIATELSKELASKGLTIISGCALGVDSAAHRGALEAGRPTVSVLGTPIDIDYPVANSGLKRNIISKGGLIISEYPPGTQTHKMMFPIRNRLLSGLADGTIIVEAAKNSGSLHTAESTMEQGKELFCLPPADIFHRRYDGVKEYLRNGAHIVFSSQDVLDVFRFVYTPPEYIQTQIGTLTTEAKHEPTEDEKKILEFLESRNLSIDELAELSEIPAYRLLPLIIQMELSGLIRKSGSGIYESQLQ